MAPNIVVSRPTFPIYLLPSISFPFRRRRPSSSSTTTSEPSSTPDASQVPSLSSSPTQSTTDETITPPNSPPPPPPSYQDAIVSSGPVVADHLPPGKRQTRRRPKRLTRTQPDTLRCSTCSSDIAFSSQIVSKGFTGRYGRAYLVAPTVPAPPRSPGTVANSAAGPEMLANVRIGKCENRQLVTGWHVVADITCLLCSAKLGWKYVDAKELSQKYKVGKFILEVERVVPFRSWEDVSEEDDDDDDNDGESQGSVGEDGDDEMEGNRLDNDVSERNGDEGAGESSEDDDEVEIVFDSEDEDDLEDMFSGTWDPEVVAKRRGRRVTAARKK